MLSNVIYKRFNYCIDKGEWPNESQHADIVQVHKKKSKCWKKIIGLSAYFQNFQKYMKN